VRRTVHEVLSRPEFRPPEQPLLQRAVGWVLDQLGSLLASLLGGGAGPVVGLVLLAAIVGLVVVVAARFSRGLTRDPELAAARPPATGRPAAEWRAEAEAAERAGQWRAALRCRYRALVADLAQRGLVDEVPGRTAGEYRVEVGRNAPTVAADFSRATDLFELAWYGNRATGVDEARRFRALADRVLAGTSA
jgi:hypothetical protein